MNRHALLGLLLFGPFLSPLPSLAQTKLGLAWQYPADKNVRKDAAVIATTDFESDDWRRMWTGGKRDTVSIAPITGSFALGPSKNAALSIKVPKGEHYGASIHYQFKDQLGVEPEEIYFRYYLRLGEDWNPERGGKLPGIGATYNRGGWGGRPSDGRNGWSARGQFKGQKNGLTEIGFYCYHADMKGPYGSTWMWDENRFKGLKNNRWYCIEQYAKLNTPGQNDGILRGWVDGKPVFEKTDLRMRDIPDLKIENIWLNLYHGGQWTASTDDHLFIDDIIIAKEYIGPKAP